MSSYNASIKVAVFIIGGFDTTERPVAIGVVILINYVVAVLANIVNILFIVFDKNLHKPMYLLICNLAVVDILYMSSASPTIIGVLLAGVNTVSYVPCLIQMFAFHWAGVMEMFALAVMAFDRLVAVSYPFQYHSYLTNARTLVLTGILWIVACAFVCVMPATVIPLPLCTSRLKYIFCDYPALIRSSCVNPSYYFNMITVISFFLIFSTFTLICVSYFWIIVVLKLSSQDKRKMGSTCLSHFIVVTCYFGPMFILIILTRMGVALTLEQRHGLQIGAILGPSLVNPFVYCFRTKEIRCKIYTTFRKVHISKLS